MPTLHRLATLRDDVIYFIALYQAWIYRVDYRRVNEFGQGGADDDEDDKKEIEAKKESESATSVGAEAKASGTDKGRKATKRK